VAVFKNVIRVPVKIKAIFYQVGTVTKTVPVHVKITLVSLFWTFLITLWIKFTSFPTQKESYKYLEYLILCSESDEKCSDYKFSFFQVLVINSFLEYFFIALVKNLPLLSECNQFMQLRFALPRRLGFCET